MGNAPVLDNFISCCKDSNLLLSVSKTKKILIDFHLNSSSPAATIINVEAAVETVSINTWAPYRMMAWPLRPTLILMICTLLGSWTSLKSSYYYSVHVHPFCFAFAINLKKKSVFMVTFIFCLIINMLMYVLCWLFSVNLIVPRWQK